MVSSLNYLILLVYRPASNMFDRKSMSSLSFFVWSNAQCQAFKSENIKALISTPLTLTLQEKKPKVLFVYQI